MIKLLYFLLVVGWSLLIDYNIFFDKFISFLLLGGFRFWIIL